MCVERPAFTWPPRVLLISQYAPPAVGVQRFVLLRSLSFIVDVYEGEFRKRFPQHLNAIAGNFCTNKIESG